MAYFNDVFRVIRWAPSYDARLKGSEQQRGAGMGASSFGIGRRRPVPRTPAPMADAIRKQTRVFEIAEYEAVLMAQSENDIIASLEALTLAAAHEMRRKIGAGGLSARRRGGRPR